MANRSIRPRDTVDVCDVCGRTLLSGEHTEIYLAEGTRRQVCELCTSRAAHNGWIREGAELEVTGRTRRRDEGGRLMGRLRARRRARPESTEEESPAAAPDLVGEERARGQRHIHAVPTSGPQKAARALELFNASDHPRRISGVARSLGVPTVAVRPTEGRPSVITIVVAWELSWYRFEVELAADGDAVRMVSQGEELSELASEEQAPNAVADEAGQLALSSS